MTRICAAGLNVFAIRGSWQPDWIRSMRKSLKIFAAVALCTLSGCDMQKPGFEIVRAGNSNYVLDRSTGAIRLLDGETLRDVKPLDIKQSQAHEWPPLSAASIGNFQVHIRTKYRDGKLLYNVSVSPYLDSFDALRLPYSETAVSINLFDSDSFGIGDPLRMMLREGQRTVDDTGKVISIEWKGEREMDSDSYQAISSVVLGWNGFPELAKEKVTKPQ